MMTRPSTSRFRSSLFASLSLVSVACSTGFGDGEYGRPDSTGDEEEDETDGSGDTSTGESTDSGGADVADAGSDTAGEDGDEDPGGDTQDSGDSGETGGSDDQGGTGTDSGGESEDSDDAGDTGDSGDTGTDSGGESGDSADGGSSGDAGEDSGAGESGEGSEDSGGGSEDSGSGGDDGPEPCQVSDSEVKPIPPNIMLVLDKSGSMAEERWDHDQNPGTPEVTRWNTLHGAVSRLTSTFEDRVKFGAKLFPEFDASGFEPAACVVDPGVEVACNLDNSATIIGSIPPAGANVMGGTPMESGLSEGISYLQGLPADEPRVVLLVADGAISCTGENFTGAVTLVTDAAAADIPTYVIGIDPDEDNPGNPNDTFDQLTALAQAGGTVNSNGPPDFFPVQNEADLDAVMEQIINESLQCVVDIDPEPRFPEFFEVWVAGVEVPLISDCATESGWHWTVPHTQIEFCNTACLDLNTAGTMQGKYFCPEQ